MEAVAQDRGFPPLSRTVEVQIDVVDRANNPPVWDQVVYGPIYVKENKNVGDRVVAVKARSVPCPVQSRKRKKERRNLYIFAWAHTHAPIGKKTNRPCPSVRPGSGVLTSCVGVCPSLSMSASAVHIKTSTSNTRATRPQPVVCVSVSPADNSHSSLAALQNMSL